MLPGLALPPDGHDHGDYDGCGHDDPEKILKYYRASIRPGDDICDKGVYPLDNQYYYWDGLYLLTSAYYSALDSRLLGTLSRPPDNKVLSKMFSIIVSPINGFTSLGQSSLALCGIALCYQLVSVSTGSITTSLGITPDL